MQQFDSFAQMQRDAEMRVMEMQKRARAAVDSYDPPPVIIEQPEEEILDATEKNKSPGEHAGLMLPGLQLSEEDSEQALILMILLLLMREKADERLIFALLYILM